MQDKTIKKKRVFQSLDIIWSRFQSIILPVLLVSISFHSSISHTNELDKSTLKALYTYNFGKFTEWPSIKLNDTTSYFHYCILGQSQFPEKTLNLIKSRTIQEKPLSIEVFDSGLIPEDVLTTCHIIFISKSEKHRLSTILNRVKTLPILTVSDIKKFSNLGGMVTFIEDQGKIRFQINLHSLQQASISISSKIMEFAEIVNGEQRL